MIKSGRPIPKFSNEEEEHKFWLDAETEFFKQEDEKRKEYEKSMKQCIA